MSYRGDPDPGRHANMAGGRVTGMRRRIAGLAAQAEAVLRQGPFATILASLGHGVICRTRDVTIFAPNTVGETSCMQDQTLTLPQDPRCSAALPGGFWRR